MSGFFPEAIAEMQRGSLAAEIREAYDGLESLLSSVVGIGDDAHIVNLTDYELADVRSKIQDAKQLTFEARVIAEKGQP